MENQIEYPMVYVVLKNESRDIYGVFSTSENARESLENDWRMNCEFCHYYWSYQEWLTKRNIMIYEIPLDDISELR